MTKKKLVLADFDQRYLYDLSDYLMEKAPQLELIAFTREDKLIQYLEQPYGADIVAVDERMASSRLAALVPDVTKVILSETMTPVEGYVLVKKYQKSEALLNEIMLRYAEHTGVLDVIQGDSHTKMAAFYSPAGGTGKTTIALSAALAGVKAGLKVLYLNLEEVDSFQDEWEPAPGSLSDVFLALKTKGMNPEITLADSVKRHEEGGFYYISGVDSISEYEELDKKDAGTLLTSIRNLKDYDLVIIDLSSSLSVMTRQVLETADKIFVPIVQEEASVSKLKRFLREKEIHETYHSVAEKMVLVVNRCRSKEMSQEFLASGLLDQLPCCLKIAEISSMAKHRRLLRHREEMLSMMEPLIRLSMDLADGERNG